MVLIGGQFAKCGLCDHWLPWNIRSETLRFFQNFSPHTPATRPTPAVPAPSRPQLRGCTDPPGPGPHQSSGYSLRPIGRRNRSARPGGPQRTPTGVPKNRPPCRGAAGRRRRNAAGRSAGGMQGRPQASLAASRRGCRRSPRVLPPPAAHTHALRTHAGKTGSTAAVGAISAGLAEWKMQRS